MAHVQAQPHGLLSKLGFGSRKESRPRKLVRKQAVRNQFESDSASNPQSQTSHGSKTRLASWNAPNNESVMRLAANGIETQPHASPSPRRLTKAPPKPLLHPALDKDTGERKDLTEMFHALSYSEALDSVEEVASIAPTVYDPSRPDGSAILARASPEIWLLIADFLSPLDVANLSSTCRTMYSRLGKRPYEVLCNPANRRDRIAFLLPMDRKLPNHLFCFQCAQWHLRMYPGFETLKPAAVLNPLFRCPNSSNSVRPPPRLPISEGRTLPFTFVQLSKRAWAYGPAYGIPVQSLARRWKGTHSTWSHESNYHISSNGHILMRIKSQVFVHPGMTPAAKRLLLFNRTDYTPYFSVCAHWKKGLLTSIPKCALDHIPVRHINALTQLRTQKAPGPVALCGDCRPMRRCPQCPTEYLVELKLVEDKSVESIGPERFKQCLLVTRWSDLGPARSPEDKEWSAILGLRDDYDSFVEIGRRAVSGIFESAFTDSIPGQRILSMNPTGVTGDGSSDDWY